MLGHCGTAYIAGIVVTWTYIQPHDDFASLAIEQIRELAAAVQEDFARTRGQRACTPADVEN